MKASGSFFTSWNKKAGFKKKRYIVIQSVEKKQELPPKKMPAGTGAFIEPWTKGEGAFTRENGYADLGEVQTDLSDLKKTNRTEILKKAIRNSLDSGFFKDRKIKNIVVLIGDGMGESHLKASRQFYGPLIMDDFPLYRTVETKSYSPDEKDEDSLVVTDSSAGGTAILCGEKTRYGYIGLNTKAEPIPNLSEMAREKGMFVGISTNDHMGDATPASALVHDTAREHESVIYEKEFKAAPDILIGDDCGIRKYVESPEGVSRGMKGYETFPQMCQGERECGYKNKEISFWKGNFAEYTPDTPAGFNMGINKEVPNFVEIVAYTLTALDHKSKANGDCGFFCMIENTSCDGWGHAGLVQQIMNEVQMFDEGVAVAAKYVLENPETLLVITADHENGDLQFLEGWEQDYKAVISREPGHSAQTVPAIAFGAGASLRFHERKKGVTAENFQTGKDIIWLLNNWRKS